VCGEEDWGNAVGEVLVMFSWSGYAYICILFGISNIGNGLYLSSLSYTPTDEEEVQEQNQKHGGLTSQVTPRSAPSTNSPFPNLLFQHSLSRRHHLVFCTIHSLYSFTCPITVPGSRGLACGMLS